MGRRKTAKRGAKARGRKLANHEVMVVSAEDSQDLAGPEEEEQLAEDYPQKDQQEHTEVEEMAASPLSAVEPEPVSAEDDDEEGSGEGSGNEDWEGGTMHTGFMQTGPKNYRCGSTLIDLTKADEDTTFNFQPKDIGLEVECGGNRAMMSLSKLYQGSKGPCIDFQGTWITPNEFQAVSGRESAKDWKRSIRHNGRSLKLLLSKGVLDVHPAACRCDSCRLLQQANEKTPTVDTVSSEEIKKKSSSGSPKKKKKKRKKNKSKTDRSHPKDKAKRKGKAVSSKTELNGDVPALGANSTSASVHQDALSTADSSSSSEDEATSDLNDSEDEKKAKLRGAVSEPATEPPKRVEAIKVKIPRNLAPNPEPQSSSDSSSSGDSSSDEDSDDDGSSDEDEKSKGGVVPFDPASLNEPLFPDLTPTATMKKPLTPVLTKKESSSEDDEPLANINRKQPTRKDPSAEDEENQNNQQETQINCLADGEMKQAMPTVVNEDTEAKPKAAESATENANIVNQIIPKNVNMDIAIPEEIPVERAKPGISEATENSFPSGIEARDSEMSRETNITAKQQEAEYIPEKVADNATESSSSENDNDQEAAMQIHTTGPQQPYPFPASLLSSTPFTTVINDHQIKTEDLTSEASERDINETPTSADFSSEAQRPKTPAFETVSEVAAKKTSATEITAMETSTSEMSTVAATRDPLFSLTVPAETANAGACSRVQEDEERGRSAFVGHSHLIFSQDQAKDGGSENRAPTPVMPEGMALSGTAGREHQGDPDSADLGAAIGQHGGDCGAGKVDLSCGDGEYVRGNGEFGRGDVDFRAGQSNCGSGNGDCGGGAGDCGDGDGDVGGGKSDCGNGDSRGDQNGGDDGDGECGEGGGDYSRGSGGDDGGGDGDDCGGGSDSNGGGGGDAEGRSEDGLSSAPQLSKVARQERKPSGNKLSRLSNIIDNLRVTKEKQVLTAEGGEKKDSQDDSASSSSPPPLPVPKPSFVPPQLLTPSEEKTVAGSSFTPLPPVPALHSSPQLTPSLPHQSQQLQHQPPHHQPSVIRQIPSPSRQLHSPSRQLPSPSRQLPSPSRQLPSPSRRHLSPPGRHSSPSGQHPSPTPGQHSRKSTPAWPLSLTSSSVVSPYPGSSLLSSFALSLPPHTSSSSSSKPSRPLSSSSSSSSAHHSSSSAPPSVLSGSRPSATATSSLSTSIPSILSLSSSSSLPSMLSLTSTTSSSLPSMLSLSSSLPSMLSLTSPSLASASPLLAGGASSSAYARQQEQLALSLQQAMSRVMTPSEISHAQLMAFQMAQNEAALQQASYIQKMMDMHKLSSSMSMHSKVERDYQMAALSALMPWPPRPDLLSPFHPLAHPHLLAAQQQQFQQQAREKELELEKQKQQQKQREREQQQKREREREREREQQKQRQEQLERKQSHHRLQEQQQQQYKLKHLQMMQEQQRKLDAAHLQFQRDMAKRPYEALAAGLALPTEQPQKAHSEAKKPRTTLPGAYPPPPLIPPSAKPRPSHTKVNGSSSSSSSSGGSSKSGSSSTHAPSLNPFNLPLPLPVSPVAAPRMWSSCFPHPLPPPSMEAAHLSHLYGLSDEASKHLAQAAVSANSRAAHTASRNASASASATTPSASASASAASLSAPATAGTGEVLDLSISKR